MSTYYNFANFVIRKKLLLQKLFKKCLKNNILPESVEKISVTLLSFKKKSK